MTIEVLKAVDSQGVTKYKYLDCENRFQVVTTEGVNYIEFKDSSGKVIPENELSDWSFISFLNNQYPSRYVTLMTSSHGKNGVCIRYDKE